MRWRLLPEEFGPDIVYISGLENVVADTIRRPLKQGDIVDTVYAIVPFFAKEEGIFPI